MPNREPTRCPGLGCGSGSTRSGGTGWPRPGRPAYESKYGWPVTVTEEGLFDAPYGAPTAGPPPYRPYAITPSVVYAFGTSDNLGIRSTRFTFSGQ